MYLKYSLAVLCCVMANVQAGSLQKNAGSKSTGSLPSVVAAFRVSASSSSEIISSSSVSSVVAESVLDVPSPAANIAVPKAPVAPMFYDFPGSTSPVYSSVEDYIKNCLCAPTSPIRSLFPCGS